MRSSSHPPSLSASDSLYLHKCFSRITTPCSLPYARSLHLHSRRAHHVYRSAPATEVLVISSSIVVGRVKRRARGSLSHHTTHTPTPIRTIKALPSHKQKRVIYAIGCVCVRACWLCSRNSPQRHTRAPCSSRRCVGRHLFPYAFMIPIYYLFSVRVHFYAHI